MTGSIGRRDKVVIVGGGAGGALLANMLASKTMDFEVTVVDKSPFHVYLPELLHIAFKGYTKSIAMPLRELLKPGVNLVIDKVVGVDFDNREVRLSSGKSLDYDYIVVAAGATIDYSQVPGLKEHVIRFGDFHSCIDNAKKVWENLRSFSKGTYAIVVADPMHRCPPSPYEGIFLAEEYFTRRGIRSNVRVVLAVPYPRAYPAESMNEIVEPILKERGIELITFFTLDKIDVENRVMYSLEGDELKYDAAVVVPFHRGPEIRFSPESVVNEDGFILADKYTNNIKGYDDAFVIGDASAASHAKTGVTAHLQARVVALRLAGFDARNTGRTHCPFEMGYGLGHSW